MTKPRSQFIYKLTGSIQARSLVKSPPTSKYAGQKYYQLRIVQADQSTKTIQVFRAKLTNPSIWTKLRKAKHGEFTGKQYAFHCRNFRGYYYLVDWEELPPKPEEIPSEIEPGGEE